MRTMHSTRPTIGALVGAALATWCAAAGGTTLAPTDFAALVSESAAIVHGRVVSTRADWADGRGHVETFVTIEVEQYLKGDLGAPIEIRIPGGDLGRYRDVFVGAPRLAVGDDVILCLSVKGGGKPHVLGLTLGVFRVRHDGGVTLVSPPPAFSRDGESRRIVRGSRSQAPVTIATFAADIADLLAKAPRERRRP
jgi:hypothetical protein